MNREELKRRFMELNEGSTLVDLQSYIQEMVAARGFDRDGSPVSKMMLLTEEVGELARAIRKELGWGLDRTKMVREGESFDGDVGEEMADVLVMLLGLANMMEIDLMQAFIKKEAENQDRVWERKPEKLEKEER